MQNTDEIKLPIWKIILFWVISTIIILTVALCLAELSLRIITPSKFGYYVWPVNMHKTFYPSEGIMPGISGDSEFITNAWGIRGDELPGEQTYRILAIGGSTTECLYLDQSESWPYILQEQLNGRLSKGGFWVGNVGKSGNNSRHHLVQMRILLDQYPGINAVVMLIGINDFNNRLREDDNYDSHFADKPQSQNQLLNEAFDRYPLEPNRPFYKKTALWDLARRVVLVNRKNEFVQDDAGDFYANKRKKRRKAEMIIDELPDLTAALDEYTRNVNDIIDEAKKRSVRIILLTQPYMWEKGMPSSLESLLWFGRKGNEQEAREEYYAVKSGVQKRTVRVVLDNQPVVWKSGMTSTLNRLLWFGEDSDKSVGREYYSIAALVEGMERYNQLLLEICRERSVECIDLASMLAKDTTVFYDDVHFNENGSRQVAQIISDYIIGHDKAGLNEQ